MHAAGTHARKRLRRWASARATCTTRQKITRGLARGQVEAVKAGEVTIPQAKRDLCLAKPSQEPVKGRCRVNGILTDDPPDVAEMRAAGKIPARHDRRHDRAGRGRSPPSTRSEAGDRGETSSGGRRPQRRGLARGGSRLLGSLTGVQERIFKENALAYRKLEQARKAYGRVSRQG